MAASAGGSNNGGDALVPVLVNGETVNAGTQTNGTTEDGRESTTVTVDPSLVEEQLRTAGGGATVTVPISGGPQVKSGVLTGRMIKNMEGESATLEIDTGDVTYVLPAFEFGIEEVAGELGATSLEDIEITVSIDAASHDGAEFIADAADENGFTVVLQPVSFTVTAEYNGRTVEISQFENYVQRMVEIPDYVSPDRVTTAIVVGEDGTVRHVPTEVVEVDGVYYAVINSLTNSTYALVTNWVAFSDAYGHWAEDAINNMGSRMVVTGVGDNNYEPNRNITRAEFATIIVRALGLAPGTGSSGFDDVSTAGWYCGYINTAVDYGIVTGYGDGTFGPNEPITREQAMTMIARAMKITGLTTTVSEGTLMPFEDASDISAYAAEGVEACVSAGLVTGRSESSIAPQAQITRAEVAVIVQRLLQKSGLIN